MAGIRKHGTHRFPGMFGPLAAATAAFTPALIYDAFGGNATGTVATAFAAGGYDPSLETVSEAWFEFSLAVTGAATNFDSVALVQRSGAGAVKNQITVAYSAAGVTSAAWVPVNMGVGSGAVVPGAGTGTLVVTTGVALPWSLAIGDIVYWSWTFAGSGLAGLTANTYLFTSVNVGTLGA
jgi:hypothetical protein